jgi:hypothetical protein
VDSAFHQIAERFVHNPLSLQSRYAGEIGALKLRSEMRFPAAVIAHMAVMLGAIVNHV